MCRGVGVWLGWGWEGYVHSLSLRVTSLALGKSYKSPRASKATLKNMHYSDVVMSTMTSQITSLTIVYLTIYSGTAHKNTKISYMDPTTTVFVCCFVFRPHPECWDSSHRSLWPHNWSIMYNFYTPRNEVRGGGGYIGFSLSVCLSVCPSVCLSVCLSVNFFVSAL